MRQGTVSKKGDSDGNAATSTRKCEELSKELWGLEQRTQEVQRKLLEHTAGILQVTHKGLKKNLKNSNSQAHTTNGSSALEFDDQSLYKTPELLDGFGSYTNGSSSAGLGLDSVQGLETKVEELSGRMRAMLIQSSAEDAVDPPPLVDDAGTGNPATSIMSHLEYIENGLDTLNSPNIANSRSLEPDHSSAQQLHELNSRLHDVLHTSGLANARPPSLTYSNDDRDVQLTSLHNGLDNVARRMRALFDQKDILTTQIQQQRVLNSKSDSERDAHIGSLTEQLMTAQKELEASQNDCQNAKESLALEREQLDTLRHNKEEGESNSNAIAEREARLRAEAEVARLESTMVEGQRAMDSEKQAHSSRARAEEEVTQLKSQLQEFSGVHSGLQDEHSRLRDVHSQLQDEHSRLQDGHSLLQDETSQHQSTISLLRNELKTKEDEVASAHSHAGKEIPRLEALLVQMRTETDTKSAEENEARQRAEEESSRLQAQLAEAEGEIVRVQTELTMCKAELDGGQGSRAVQQQMDELNSKNLELTEELAALKAGPPINNDLQKRAEILEKELRETIDDYEAITKASIEMEKERERSDNIIDGLRDRCEQVETQLNEERINSLGATNTRDAASETTSTMVLKNEFKKMMRDTRAENMRILKVSRSYSFLFLFVSCQG